MLADTECVVCWWDLVCRARLPTGFENPSEAKCVGFCRFVEGYG